MIDGKGATRAALVCVVVLLCCSAGARGVTGLAFLKNGVDARAAILGQAMTSLADDAAACYWNPAGLAHRDRGQLLLAHVESFADLRREYVSALQPAGPLTFGILFNGLWSEDLEGYDEAGNPTGAFGYSAFAAGVAAGHRAAEGITLGAAAKYLREDIGRYGATGWALDAGAQWQEPQGLPVRLGLAVRNIGPSMKFISTEFGLPLTVQGGVSWELRPLGPDSRLLLASDVRHVRDEGTAMLVGVEYGYRNLLSFGGGYQGGQDVRDVSLGIGAHAGPLDLHWAYLPLAEDLGDEHLFSVRIDL